MKKILVIIMACVLCLGLIGSAFAYFSDTETSTGNTFTAGTLDLTVDSQDDPNVVYVTESNMKPGDTRRNSWCLKNVGSIDGQPSITFSNIVNNDNGLTEPESAVDTTGGAGEGELGAIAYVAMRFRQPCGSGSWTSIRLTNNCGDPHPNGLNGLTVGLGQLNGCAADTPFPVLSQDEELEVQFTIFIMSSVGNIIQSDSVALDITFNLDQVP
jgi:spore coat-associated protein N